MFRQTGSDSTRTRERRGAGSRGSERARRAAQIWGSSRVFWGCHGAFCGLRFTRGSGVAPLWGSGREVPFSTGCASLHPWLGTDAPLGLGANGWLLRAWDSRTFGVAPHETTRAGWASRGDDGAGLGGVFRLRRRRRRRRICRFRATGAGGGCRWPGCLRRSGRAGA